MSDNKTTKKTNENEILIESHKLPFKKKEDQIMLLKALFKYGYPNLSFESFPLMSPEALNETIKITLEKLGNVFQNIPSLVHWLHGGLFKNAESVPMALLFIEWYEQHPSHQDNTECNFRYVQ